jgi:AraC-like DNA-binding protein
MRADQALLSPHLYEIDGARLTSCGGAASIDFALTLVDVLFGATVQAQVKEILCVDRVRGPDERQRVALQARFGVLQPKLTEAVTLMEANIEEPLSTDDIAQLAGVSRRQLERLFKQYLGSLPSRYYLELRLQRARQLLRDTNYSIVQVGLMCGFSSGSHFSTAFGALFANKFGVRAHYFCEVADVGRHRPSIAAAWPKFQNKWDLTPNLSNCCSSKNENACRSLERTARFGFSIMSRSARLLESAQPFIWMRKTS